MVLKGISIRDLMIAEINIDNDNKIVGRTLSGEIDTAQALKLALNISHSVKLNQDYNILIDIRDTTFYPEMVDLFEIAEEFSKLLLDFNQRIAIIIPNTEQRKQVAKLFQICMEAENFNIMHFIDYDDAIEWLSGWNNKHPTNPQSDTEGLLADQVK